MEKNRDAKSNECCVEADAPRTLADELRAKKTLIPTESQLRGAGTRPADQPAGSKTYGSSALRNTKALNGKGSIVQISYGMPK